VPAGARILDVSRLLRQVQCYLLDLGEPDATADLVERIAHGVARASAGAGPPATSDRLAVGGQKLV